MLAVQLRPPNLDGITTIGDVLHALVEQRVQFGDYALAFLVVGGLWLDHHQLLDPMQTHGRRLAKTNLVFLLTVSLLPYWVGVLEAHKGSAAGGLLLLAMALTRIAFLLVCLDVRAELGPSRATTELVVPALLRSAAPAVLFLAIGAVVAANPRRDRPPVSRTSSSDHHGEPESARQPDRVDRHSQWAEPQSGRKHRQQ